MLRFAITGASGAALVVDVSIKVDDTAQKTKKGGKKTLTWLINLLLPILFQLA